MSTILRPSRSTVLVLDAHAAIAREIADNLQALSASMPSLDEHERALRTGLRFADELRKRGKTDIRSLNFGIVMASLHRASWQSAERTGALGYMAFADVKAYAEIYDLQDLVVGDQRQQLVRISDVTARLFGGENGDPTLMRPAELETFRSRVLDALGAAATHKTLSAQLLQAYKEAPNR
jgi:hypothetical protein